MLYRAEGMAQRSIVAYLKARISFWLVIPANELAG